MTNYAIVMTKWVGLYGTVRIAKEKKEDLLTRLPEYLIEDAARFEKYLSTEKDTETAKGVNECETIPLGAGGLYKALYELSKEKKCGITAFAKAIPIRQETIEISEFYDINPYMLNSQGSILIITPREKVKDLLLKLAKNEIPAAMIGRFTGGNDCIVTNGERRTYIKPPKEDGLWCVIPKERSDGES